MLNSPRQFARIALLNVLPKRLLIDRGSRGSRQIYLTFDDGPHADHTPRLLAELRDHGLKATFFVVGQEAQRHPELVQQIAREGHALGTHSWQHAPAAETSADRLVEETMRARALIFQLTGARTNLCRPPFGAVSATKLWRLWRVRQTVVLWNVDPRDYACQSSSELEEHLRKTPPQAGDIVLLHDNRPASLGSIHFFSALCEASGCTAGTLDELLPRDAASLQAAAGSAC